MIKYVLTKKAVADLTGIWKYTIDMWGEKQAEKYYSNIINTFQQLADNPSIGRDYSFIADNLFGFRIERHIIFYRIALNKSNTTIEVVRILHERMDLRNRILES